jgi:SAM-dependent methyltransferase
MSAQRYARALRRRTPMPVKRFARRLLEVSAPPAAEPSTAASTYADLYEQHAIEHPPETSIGRGDFDRMGQIELAILTDAGLKPSSTLLDFGCGTGRLAVHAIPFLSDGQYIGTDISPTMLVHAGALVTDKLGSMPINARFVVQPDETFPVDPPVDFLCAYSVFTHMEHEDTFRYLKAALAASTTGTTFVASVLQIDTPVHQHEFLMSAAKTVDERWASVRNIVTSQDLFTTVAELAGWTVSRWLPVTESAGTMPDGERVGVGQSIVIMRPTA